MTKDKALTLALEALNKLTDVFLDTEGKHGDYEQKALNQGNKTILAIKEALVTKDVSLPEQPTIEQSLTVEQEPVAWQWLDTANFRKKIPPTGESECWNPLFTSPPKREWVGLTEVEVVDLFDFAYANDREFVLNVEAKLKEKNGL